jgi:hypothetical protein
MCGNENYCFFVPLLCLCVCFLPLPLYLLFELGVKWGESLLTKDAVLLSPRIHTCVHSLLLMLLLPLFPEGVLKKIKIMIINHKMRLMCLFAVMMEFEGFHTFFF